jgi:uncharacterized protein (DUF2225 family)
VCNKKIEVTKVKTKDCVISSRDTDFCIYYEGINPMFYDSWVCEFCGYAALSEKFESLSKVFVNPIKNSITSNWKTRRFCGERDINKAIEAYKLALLSLSYTKAKASQLAKVSIRIAWLYRLKKDDENELAFLKHTLNFYHEIYEKEDLPIGKLDKYTCIYMIAELSRRVEKHEDALSWFSKVLSSPEARANKLIIENTREQVILIREQQKRVKVSV